MGDICAICGDEKSDTRVVKTITHPNEENRGEEKLRVCSECGNGETK